jgi:hypothetical protein
MYSRKAVVLRVVALWVGLLCLAWLQFQQNAPVLLVCLCACLSLSLGILATFVLFLQARKSAGSVKEIRALCEGLYLYFFLMSVFVICLLSAQLRQSPRLGVTLPILFMGLLVIGAAVWVVRLGMRVLRALEDKAAGE